MNYWFRFLISLSLLCSLSRELLAQEDCPAILEELAPAPVNNQSATLDFIGFWGFLIKEQTLTVAQYEVFLASVVQGKPQSPFTAKILGSSAKNLQYGIIFQSYLDQWKKDKTFLDTQSLLENGKMVLANHGRKLVEKAVTALATENPFYVMKFHPISQNENLQISVMSTLVTQWMWTRVMGYNPSRFRSGKDSTSILMNGEYIELRPDHPVELVNLPAVRTYLAKLQQMDEEDHPDLKILFIDHQKGDRYRLIKESEYRYVMNRGGRPSTAYFYGDSRDDLKLYAWFRSNSRMETQSVASLRAHVVGAGEFYDISGNVKIWSEDSFHYSETDSLDFQTILGSSFQEDAYFIEAADRLYRLEHKPIFYSSSDLGLRLVRERKISQ